MADRVIRRIAIEVLKIPTLDRRKSDSLDYHSLPVWLIEKALTEAYEAGIEQGERNAGEQRKVPD